jgi:hypothetical protein
MISGIQMHPTWAATKSPNDLDIASPGILSSYNINWSLLQQATPELVQQDSHIHQSRLRLFLHFKWFVSSQLVSLVYDRSKEQSLAWFCFPLLALLSRHINNFIYSSWVTNVRAPDMVLHY